MGLAEALARDVPERTRVKGNRYFLGGAVRSIEGSATHVTAVVRGSEWYQVHLTRFGDEILASCGCPYFADRNDFCKHIWAVILAADAEGFLIGDSPLTKDVYLESAYTGEVSTSQAGQRPAPRPAQEPWQRFLDGVKQRATAPPASPALQKYSKGEIVYVLEDEAAAPLVPLIQIHWRTRKKNGEWGRPQPAAFGVGDLEVLADPNDRQIVSLLLGAGDPYGLAAGYASVSARAQFRLAGPLTERVLPLIAQSGRLFLRERAGPERTEARPRALALDTFRDVSRGWPDRRGRAEQFTELRWDGGPPWTFRLDVSLASADRILVDGAFERGDARLPASGPRMILSPDFLVLDGAVARFEHDGALPWLLELRHSGPALVPADATPALAEAMAQSAIDPARLPEPLRYEVVSAAPVPRIRMARSPRPHGHGTRDALDAVVEFDYAGTIVPAGTGAAGYDPEKRRMVRRDEAAERAAINRLQELGFHRPWYLDARAAALAIPIDRFPAAVRVLVDEGWHVEAEGRMFRAAKALQMQVKSGVDWFELHGTADFGDGRSVSIASLLAALKRGEATVVLDDGTRGMVPEEWLRRYARVASFGEDRGDHVRYQPSQTALLDALLETQPSVDVDERFARARAELTTFSGVRAIDPPRSFRGRLRDYQREALGWFEFLRRFGFGGCLADDMGLGKTVMVLALLEARRTSRERGAPRTSAAIVPRSLVFNWIEEARRFAPDLRILDYTGEARATTSIDDYDLLLTTYGTLRRDAARLATQAFDYVILDEAQAIKNATTASAKAARVLRARHRLALSGTPIENHLGELWSLFEFLNPGFLGPAAAFGRIVTGPGRAERADIALIARALRPFILRRTKEQVAPELPEKVEQTIHCELEGPQRKFYDELRTHYRQSLLRAVATKGLNRSKLQILEALLRLRQAATHPALVDPGREGESSAKFDLLLARLRELADEGHKALVFSQFTTLLGLLRPRLDEAGIVYEYLDGRTRDRASRVERFETDERCPVFLISLKAGGVGLNLTAADYVFLLDPWWNPAVEAQAIDRTHRIGQAKHVFAYRLIARDTVEEKIAELQESKRELADAIYAEDAGLIRTIRPEDLEWLLS
jgi:superfamily II DNA or RNA helicase